MPETREPRSVVEAAEQAAAAGDYAAAEQLLREAALLQEASLGPLHPDLANTLNNLGVVCEITEKPDDAEQFFRRACAIATAVLEPDHPFVATSRKNLEDFCIARGKAVDLPSAAPSADDRAAPATGSDELPAVDLDVSATESVELPAADLDASATESVEPPPERPSYEESRPVVSTRSSRPLAIGALIAGGVLLMFVARATWFRSGDKVQSSPGSPTVSSGSPATTAGPPPAEPIAPDTSKKTGTSRGGSVGVRPKSGVTASTPPLVAAAQLCRSLSTGGPRGASGDWHCVPPGLPVSPGPLVFYTRIKSRTATTVQHRWYRDDRLRKVADLAIGANTTSGYRTYSRHTVDSQGSGDWKVELRTKDGIVLHEERFVVR
jgi:hypothetical protein